MICPSCGLQNRPYEPECVNCGRELQDAASAGEQRRRWDELAPKLREEYEKDFDGYRKAYDDHRGWLKRHRTVHAVLGAVFLTLIMNLSFMFLVLEGTFFDLAAGAVGGVVLNMRRGGGLLGAGLFGGAAGLAVVGRLAFMASESYWAGWFLPSACGITLALGVGYYVGLRLAGDHVERTL